MNDADQWDLIEALPFLIAAGWMLYVATVALGGRALRLKRRQRQREAEAHRRDDGAMPPAPPPTPWSRWLDDINERAARGRLDDAEDKWRE